MKPFFLAFELPPVIASNLTWIIGDAVPLPLPDASFSVVVTRVPIRREAMKLLALSVLVVCFLCGVLFASEEDILPPRKVSLTADGREAFVPAPPGL